MHVSSLLTLTVVGLIVVLAAGSRPALASIVDYEEDEDVLVLNEENFEKAVAEFKFLFVDFFAPWCSHCKALAPEFAKAAESLRDSDSEIHLAKVDASIHKELAEKYNIKGYPTLKLFRHGSNPVNYKANAGHTASDILIWLRKKTGSPVVTVQTVKDARDFIEKEELVAIGFFQDIESSRAAKSFIEAADVIDDILFVVTDSKAVRAEFGIQKDTVVVFKKFDEGRVDLVASDELTAVAIEAFVDENRLPLVIEFTEDTAPKIFASPLRIHFLLFVSKDSKSFNKKLDELRDVAALFKGQAIFIYVDADPEAYKRILDFFGLKRSSCPTYRLVNLDGNIKYKPDTDEPSTEELVQFLDDALSGKRKPFLMSETLPKDWDSKPVKELVGNNFDEVARDKNKDVFVKFYAPWCDHCKALAPVWEELSEKYKDRDDVVIAKIDATANEADGVKITIFPTLILFPKDSNTMYEFPAALNKTLDRLTTFLDNNGHLPEEEAKLPVRDDSPKPDNAKKEEL